MRTKGNGFFAAADTQLYTPASAVAGQRKDDSCLAACILTLLRDQGRQDVYEVMLRAALGIQGEGGLLSDVPRVLQEFGSTVPYCYREDLTLDDLQQACTKGPALVALRRREMGSHALLVDGIEDDAYVLIRDPLPELIGAAYKVAIKTFLNAWLSEEFGRGVVVE